MNEFFAGLAASVAKALPVGLASRTAFLGVLVLSVAGGFHEHGNRMYSAAVEAQLTAIRADLQGIKELQQERKDDLVERLDRLEKKIDKLLLGDRQNGR